MSCLHCLCLFGSSLPPVVCRRDHVLFTLFVFVWFVFTSSCMSNVGPTTLVAFGRTSVWQINSKDSQNMSVERLFQFVL
jgi:hypothetical protein